MSTMCAMLRSSWMAASVRRRRMRVSTLARNSTASPRNTTFWIAWDDCRNTANSSQRGASGRCASASSTVKAIAPINAQLPTRSGTLGRRKIATRPIDPAAAASKSAHTRDNPEPGKRSPIRCSRRRSVSTIWVPSSRRYNGGLLAGGACTNLLESERHAQPDGGRAQRPQRHQERGREPPPIFVAHLGRREDRHERAVGGREQLAHSTAVLVGQYGHLTRQAEQVRERHENRQRENRMPGRARYRDVHQRVHDHHADGTLTSSHKEQRENEPPFSWRLRHADHIWR